MRFLIAIVLVCLVASEAEAGRRGRLFSRRSCRSGYCSTSAVYQKAVPAQKAPELSQVQRAPAEQVRQAAAPFWEGATFGVAFYRNAAQRTDRARLGDLSGNKETWRNRRKLREKQPESFQSFPNWKVEWKLNSA